ncbi:MAG: L,D-transpeptidase family protein [Rhodospirillales bacterium]
MRTDLIVVPDTLSTGWLSLGEHRFRCALGRSGVRTDKREGDGATPSARMKMRRVFYRPDRIASLVTALPSQALTPSDGWCDDPAAADYNRLIGLPHPARHERLWRDDNIYDVIVELGWNDEPVIAGNGSAIFLHVARENFTPTEGCVALALGNLLTLLRVVPRNVALHITAAP